MKKIFLVMLLISTFVFAEELHFKSMDNIFHLDPLQPGSLESYDYLNYKYLITPAGYLFIIGNNIVQFLHPVEIDGIKVSKTYNVIDIGYIRTHAEDFKRNKKEWLKAIRYHSKDEWYIVENKIYSTVVPVVFVMDN